MLIKKLAAACQLTRCTTFCAPIVRNMKPTLIKHSSHENEEKDHQDKMSWYPKNSPYLHIRKRIGNSKGNMHLHLRGLKG